MVRRKGHRHLTKTFAKKVFADRWGREKEQEIDDGSYRDTAAASRALLGDLFDKYLATITPTKESSSHVPERARIGTLKRYFGARPDRAPITLAQLSVAHVLEYVDHRLQKVSSDAIRRELQLLADVVDSAQTLWNLHIVANPVPNAKRILRKLRKLKPGNQRERRLLAGEYERIRDATHSHFTLINQVALFAIETAMRQGEIAAARREHVNREKRVIYVPKSKMDWLTGKKGKVVPLSSVALQILDTLPVQFIDGSLFGMTPGAIKKAFARLCRQQKLKGLRFHDLCHEATSRLFEAGFRIEEVAAITGKKDWRTLKRYTHPDPEKLALRMS